MRSSIFTFSTVLLASVSPATAQLPYNPTQLILSFDQTKIYQFSAQASQPIFSYFDVSKQISSTSSPIVINENLDFLSSDEAAVAVADNDGISVLAGDCQSTSSDTKVWRFTPNQSGRNGTWKELDLDSSQITIAANYLSAGFSFTPDGSASDAALYIFGGMCPDGPSNTTSWALDASYANTMYSVSAATGNTQSQLSVTGTRAPPIAEAGLTITPLSLVSSKSSTGQTSQQQNFVLLGGHTQTAFINMSQIALFSLPEASWAFIDVSQPDGASGELVKRDGTVVTPRSGHTAVLTEDGSKIIVFGGWVGSVTSAASPQLAVLEVGQGYGGTETWRWSIPKQSDAPFGSNQGVYGHGAVMLPGNIMMITGGTTMGASKQKRSTQNHMFYNVETGAWSTTYKVSKSTSSTGLDATQKAGLGAGLGLGLTALLVILAVWWFYRRKMSKKRAERERHLRELAFGSERHHSSSRVVSRTGGSLIGCDVRSASWGSRQEQQIESSGFAFPWSSRSDTTLDVSNRVERTALDVPSPTRGLRKSLSTRGPASYGNVAAPTRGPGSVFRIDEVEEEGSVTSMRAKSAADSRMSDPFKDPPNVLDSNPAAEERKRDVQGWMEDWQSAAVSMKLSRNPSQARTYSTLSQAQSISDSASFKTGRESPEKSDRTGSNLSERSAYSIQRSGMVSRQPSQRSNSAGYALFAGAAAAMAKLGGLERTASKRSISLNTAAVRRSASNSQRPRSREAQSLLDDYSPVKSTGELSPIKDYKNYSRTSSMTSTRKKAGILGSVKRVLTGTGHVDVQAHVEHFEERTDLNSPTRPEPEMSETTNSPAFWQGKKGARDWHADDPLQQSSLTPAMAATSSKRRSDVTNMTEEYDGEEWDVETAVQKRVVQVMFTVPKEKLRVVNADALSLISRSDVDERESNLSRMNSMRDNIDREKDREKGKEKETGDD